jgi:hypothetical protein
VSLSIAWAGACLLFVIGNLVAALLSPNPAEVRFPDFVREAMQRVYPDLSSEDLRALRNENRREFESDFLVQPREAPSSGRWVNVDENGFRVSRNQGPWPPQDRYYNVFVFGGSTTFGYGVPDDQTIASHLQELLPPVRERTVRVYNFGRGSYYSTQERILFAKLAALGYVPDLAIFIDGLNDFVHCWSPPTLTVVATRNAEAAEGRSLMTALRDLPILRRLRPVSRLFEIPNSPDGPHALAAREDRKAANRRTRRPQCDSDEAVDAVIERYVANKAVIEALGAAYGAEVALVWQAVPTYKYDLRYHTYRGEFPGQYSKQGYPRMAEFVARNPLGVNFLWCADIQENVAELLYVDQVHYSPDMSRRVARCIVDRMLERGMLSRLLTGAG